MPGSPVSTLLVRGLSGDSKPEGLFPSFRATTSRVPTYLAGPQLSPALTTHLLPAWLDCCVCDSHRWEWHLPCLHPFLPSRDPALLTSCVCSTLSLMDPRPRRPQPSTPACRICSGRCGAEPSGPPRFSHLLHTSPPSFCPGTGSSRLGLCSKWRNSPLHLPPPVRPVDSSHSQWMRINQGMNWGWRTWQATALPSALFEGWPGWKGPWSHSLS